MTALDVIGLPAHFACMPKQREVPGDLVLACQQARSSYSAFQTIKRPPDRQALSTDFQSWGVSHLPVPLLPVRAPLAGVQSWWIQGIQRGDSFGDQDMIELKI